MQVSQVSEIVASVVVSGKSKSDKRLSVIPTASGAALAYAIATPGKVGKQARGMIAAQAVPAIAEAFVSGNYRPFAEAVSITLGESCTIPNRRVADALLITLPERLRDILRDLKGGGYSAKTGKPTSARADAERLLSAIVTIEAYVAKKNAEREARAALANAAQPAELPAALV